MTKAEVYDAWAPRDSIWAPWAKPVVFAHAPPTATPSAAIEPQPLPNAPTAPCAIVLDLPGAAAIPFALDLATRGYRPVPLYNACPARDGDVETVAVRPIRDALVNAAAPLRTLRIPNDAAPVFLLDADRRGAGLPEPRYGEFDNRSVSLPTDFPSAAFLAARGIARVHFVQATGLQPQADLAHTLRRYAEADLHLTATSLDAPAPPAPLHVPRPPRFGAVLHRLLSVMGLRHNPLGGFGGTLGEGGGG